MDVVWEVPENLEKAKKRLDFVLHGCKCKTGCTTRRCKCRKEERDCGPGCQCINCHNTHHSSSAVADIELEVQDQLESLQDDQYVDESDNDLEVSDDELDEIMESVFGGESDSEDC